MAKRTYYFGYYETSTGTDCCTWSEEDGVYLGSRMKILHKVEISEQECHCTSLNDLKLKHPYSPV